MEPLQLPALRRTALAHSETVPNSFEYVGQFGVQRDGTGLDYMRARYYTAADGRFINEDPIGVLGGLNLYRYVSNDPVQRIDPSGLSFLIYATTESLTIFVDVLVEIEAAHGGDRGRSGDRGRAYVVRWLGRNSRGAGRPHIRFGGGGFIATDLLIGFGAVVGAAAAGVVAGNGFNDIAEFTSGMTLGDALYELIYSEADLFPGDLFDRTTPTSTSHSAR